MIITLNTDTQTATVERTETDEIRIGYITGVIQNLFSNDWMDWTLKFKQPNNEHNTIKSA